MKLFDSPAYAELAGFVKNGGVGVIPTDTVYGIVASAANETAVERLYRLRKRDAGKPCIVLVGERDQIIDTAGWRAIDWYVTQRYWPGPFSIVLPATDATPAYLRRDGQTLAYRLPDYPELRELLRQAGPVIAPTANLQGEPPATTLAEAQAYFGDTVDFYVDAGRRVGQPSTLITTEGGKVTVLRQGVGEVDGRDL
jgi:L-threonylcarbamoyladenylate synthase